MITKFKILLFMFSILASVVTAQTCGNKEYASKEELGDGFDYRGQTTYGRLLPGDTSRVKVVLYSKNVIRIMVRGDESLPGVKFKVLKSIREYKRVVDRVEKNVVEEPVYKVYDNGELVQKYDDWGEPEFDEFGDPVYEIEKYNEITTYDTIWKTERFLREEELYNSEKGAQPYFEEAVKNTKSVIIEVIVPKSGEKTEGCVAVMVGRKFFSTNYNKFSPNN